MAGKQTGLAFARTGLQDIVERLEAAVSRLEAVAACRSRNPDPSSSSRRSPTTVCLDSVVNSKVLQDFDGVVIPCVQRFGETCSAIGDVVGVLGGLVSQTFQQQRQFILQAGAASKPDQQSMQALLQPTSSSIDAIQALKEANRSSPFFNHLSAVSESISAVGWVTVAPAPVPFIAEMMDSAQFFLNRILKDFKDKDPLHKDFVRQWVDVLNQLRAYVKEHHTVGFSWKSVPAGDALKLAPKGPSSVGPPPPPPPPPSDYLVSESTTKGNTSLQDARQALFAEINKGLDISRGLKKVTPEMQTHKNPQLRAGDRAPPMAKPKVATKPAHLTSKRPSPNTNVKPPVLECQGGKKWMVEHQVDTTPTIVIEDMKQVVYMYKCTNCTLQIKGKLNGITMDACTRSRVVFDDLVSSVEVINCEKVQLQTFGALPTITIQKTDGCLLYLSRKALDCEIVSSRSSEMNVLIPNEEGEFEEYSVPEQFKTFWNGKQLQSKPTDSA
uniref:Adenylyl cyclase-associated protein n=1 Tax=Trichuris muris TaxID=70415 RepID=A0A5S6R691_TRIMR